ncbi:hypothetical protein FVE67_00585 [Thermosulfurimonas marina]|uniref:Uncharacterized protein n=1 Tax=Thermosulfurimonas marina TaxID=2047767 RepID=A0A6H1WQ81_9BACT|nr:hypothetical protein [Thermosulfurimonas marina]QJA05375.1 hypothetical protein FVE67_00585 [Thermosulfurimonas marina]
MSVAFDDYDDELYDRRRPSWRELDRRRDRSGYARVREKQEKESPGKTIERSSWLKGKYLKEVEKLFSGKKGSPEHEKALKKLKNAYGTKRFTRVAREYVENYGLPEDWNTLLLLLEAEDEELVCQALEDLKAQAGEKSPLERQGFIAKVRSLTLISESPRIKTCAEKILSEMGT